MVAQIPIMEYQRRDDLKLSLLSQEEQGRMSVCFIVDIGTQTQNGPFRLYESVVASYPFSRTEGWNLAYAALRVEAHAVW